MSDEMPIAEDLRVKAQDDLDEMQAAASRKTAMDDFEKAALALARAGISTLENSYGTNSSWAISDLCRAVEGLAAERDRLRKALEDIASLHWLVCGATANAIAREALWGKS